MPINEPFKERELEILDLIAQGWTNREIADHLYISVNTVRWYNKQIYGKLDVHSRTLAVARARQLGLLGDDGTESGETNVVSPSPLIPAAINLPEDPTPFVGRADELRSLGVLLDDPDVRLISVVAAGGMGKSRLAVEAARHSAMRFRHGAAFVALAPLRETDDIAPAIASAIDFQPGQGTKPQDELLDELSQREMLLVLDNFDHLLDGVKIISEILEICSGIKLIVTSRERLNLREETLFPTAGMGVDNDDKTDPLGIESVQLFIQSAQRARPDYQPSADDLEAIAEICRLVEGMPLGIELAAAWMEMLGPVEIMAEVASCFDFLETELRNVPERHRSVRAVFNSTWRMLAEEERNIYANLAVFRGGFTRDAAEIVAGADLRTLMAFGNKSLLWRDPEIGRYQTHELLRQYAEEELAENAPVYDAHSEFFVDLLELQEMAIIDYRQPHILEHIEADFENIRSAWNRAIDMRDCDRIDRALPGLYHFCTRRGRFADALRMIERALGLAVLHPDVFDADVVLNLREYRGRLHSVMGHFEQAVDDLEAVQETVRETGDAAREQQVLIEMGQVYRRAGHPEAASRRLNRVLEDARAGGDKRTVANVLYHLGTVAWDEGDNIEARELYDEAVAICRELGLTDLIAVQALHGLGESLLFSGHPQAAIDAYRESLELARGIGDKSYEAENQMMIAWAMVGSIGLAAYDEAEQAMQAALSISRTTHIEWHEMCSRIGLGLILGYRGDYQAGIETVRQGLQKAEKLGIPRLYSLALDNEGQLLQDLNLYEQAEDVHRQGMETAMQVEYAFWLPRLQANYAIDRMRQGDLNVENDLTHALTLAMESGQEAHAVRALEGLAELAVKRGEGSESLAYADQLLDLATPRGLQEVIGQAQRWRGEALLAMDDLDGAAQALTAALEIAEGVGRARLVWDIHDALARLHDAKGESAKAETHRETVQSIVGQIAARSNRCPAAGWATGCPCWDDLAQCTNWQSPSICSLLVLKHAAEAGATRVKALNLVIGELSSVVDDFAGDVLGVTGKGYDC